MPIGIPFRLLQVAAPVALGGALAAALSRAAPCALASGAAAACASLLAALSSRPRAATAVVPAPAPAGPSLPPMTLASNRADWLVTVGRITLGVVHDLNNHLAAVSSNAALLLQRRDLAPEARVAVNDIQASCDACADLARGLLALARGNGRTDRDLEIHQVLEQIAALLERTSDRRARIQLELGPGIAWIYGDKSQLTNAFLNLGLNALEAMPGGGQLVLSTSVVDLGCDVARRRGLRPGRYVRIEVSDSGAGIAPEHLPFIFEPFFTTKEGGSGLGLANVRDAIASHRGAIEVESLVGAGTTFTVFLPCARVTQLPSVPGGAAAGRDVAGSPGEREPGARGRAAGSTPSDRGVAAIWNPDTGSTRWPK